MLHRSSTPGRRDQREAADGGYFAPLASAGQLLLTTFERDGTPASALVPGALDGDRAYFEVRCQSDAARRLRHTDIVQVTPCRLRGFFTYGTPLDASARLLRDEEASQAAGRLADKRPVQRAFARMLPHRARRRPTVHYELLADGPGRDRRWDHFLAPAERGAQPWGRAAGGNGPFTRLHWARADGVDTGASSIACIWAAPKPG